MPSFFIVTCRSGDLHSAGNDPIRLVTHMLRGFKRILLVSIPACTALPAGADVFKCVDGEGHVTYTNDKSSARGCKLLSSDVPVSSVPGAGVAPPKPAGPASSGGFPSVSGDQQKARDSERRRILEAELDTEMKSLDAARKALSEGESVRLGDERNYQKYLDRIQGLKDNVALHERNVDALRKEIAKLP